MGPERIELSAKERERLKVLQQVEEGHLKQIEAAQRLHLTDRQVRRLQSRLRAEGDGGILHGLRGRRSPKRLKEWIGNRQSESLSGPEMENRISDVAASEKWAASTYNHYRSLLMLVYREARRAGKVSANPAPDIRHRKENNSRVRFLSRADEKGRTENGEYARLVKVIRAEYPEHLAEFIFALNTGVRLSSQYGATYDMIDWTRNVLDLPRTKNDEPVHVPLNSEALGAIRSLPSWKERKGPIFRNLNHPEKAVLSNDHWFKPAMKNAGIIDFKWHDLRHTFASWLVQDGVPLDRSLSCWGTKV